MSSHRWPVAALLLSSLLVGGCSTPYLLTSKFVISSQAEQPPEVIETPSYTDSYSKIYTVAVRAPDSCSNQTAASATGEARASGTILKTECGVEMAELERALARKGYRVISWKVLARELAVSGKSASEVASALGAEVLFQINSLEKSEKSLGKDARWERNYFLSNEYGDRVGEQMFDEPTRQYLRTRYLQYSEQTAERSGLRQPSVTLDANAVLVTSGESIWYYRWTHADPSGINYQAQVLVSCKGNNRDCVPRSPLRRDRPIATETRSSGDSDAVSVSEKPEDRLAAVHAALLSDAVRNLVESFSKGKMVARPPPLAPPVAEASPALAAPATAETPTEAPATTP